MTFESTAANVVSIKLRDEKQGQGSENCANCAETDTQSWHHKSTWNCQNRALVKISAKAKHKL